MTDLKAVVPAPQAAGYLAGIVLILIPLLAFRDAPELFGSGGWRALAAVTATGGAVATVAFVRRGERLLASVAGFAAGVAIAWFWRLELAAGVAIGGKLQIIIAVAVGLVPAAGVIAAYRWRIRRSARRVPAA